MKNPDRAKVSQLTRLPNIGKAMEAQLQLLGIKHPKDLIAKNPYKLYEELSLLTGTKPDLCVIDVFISVIRFMEGAEPKPWWFYTNERKKYFK